ncbi:hypothetical protein ONZ43_g1850 [Nemania bipapillata]|uniref:Uncharacterized protein n=1 Tax=Nemania bipapillata TaxID=110536 RepID=A0ACC2J2W4_9PEZI|nr:hypothetical protein ONZ43_g1850 [Nemania bipapillata]
MDSEKLRDQERGLREAEKRIERAETDTQLMRRNLRPTNLDEYIEVCHNLLYTKLKVEPNLEKTTSIPIPLPYTKLFPRRLMPWTDFYDQQSEMVSIIYQHFEFEEELFDSLNYLETVGKKIPNGPIASESMLEMLLHQCVEDPVRCIVYELSKSRGFQGKLEIGSGIVFESHFRALGNSPSKDLNPQSRQPLLLTLQESGQAEERPKTPDPVEDSLGLNLGKICNYLYIEEGKGKRRAIAISKYKAPYELSLAQLRAGLKEMDMMEVVPCSKIPKDEEGKFNYYATKLVASAITQVFHYMVKSGLAYGLLTTGEGIVFLKLDWSNPETVYYHLAKPAEEVSSHKDFRSYSAVSQYLGFHLLALRDYLYRGQDVRENAVSRLSTWGTEFRKAGSTVQTDQQNPPPTSSSYKPSRHKNVEHTLPRQSQPIDGARGLRNGFYTAEGAGAPAEVELATGANLKGCLTRT